MLLHIQCVFADSVYVQFLSLCRALALHDLPNDPRFSSNAQRVANRVELQRVLQSLFLQQNAQHWVQLLNSAGVPAQPINNMCAGTFIPFPPFLDSRLQRLQGKGVCARTSESA